MLYKPREKEMARKILEVIENLLNTYGPELSVGSAELYFLYRDLYKIKYRCERIIRNEYL